MFKQSKWILVCTAALLISGCSNASLSESKAGGVTKKELEQRLDSRYGSSMLEQMTMEKILLSKYPVSASLLQTKTKDFMTQQGLKSETDLVNYLKTQNMSRADFDQNIKVSLAYEQALLSTVKDAKTKEDAEYNKLKDQVRASHILVDTQQEAEDLLKQIKADPSQFETLAKTKSKDTASAAQNGDLGFFSRGFMDASFEDAAFALQKGQISDVVKSQFGYHIIKVTDRTTKSKSELLPTIWENVLQAENPDESSVISALKKEYNYKVLDNTYKQGAK